MDLVGTSHGTVVGFWSVTAECEPGWSKDDGMCGFIDKYLGYKYNTQKVNDYLKLFATTAQWTEM